MNVASLSVAELRRRFEEEGRIPSYSLLKRLREDPRKGVRSLHEVLRKRFNARRREQRRLSRILEFEQELWSQGVSRVCGVDEVGVGPLAGPVVAAAVIFPPFTSIPEVDDSKKLDPEKRVELESQIRHQAAAIGIGSASVEEIEEINVYQAALLAMRRAVRSLPEAPQRLLVDARRIPHVEIPQDSITRGDSSHFSIAAASIIAKTHRDRLMECLDRQHPAYGFASNKGYATPRHQQAIRDHGPCEAHRMSYIFVKELAGRLSTEFYQLKSRLEEVSGAEELCQIRRDYRRMQGSLSDLEQRKLQLLIGKCCRQFPVARQLSLLGFGDD